MSSDRIIDLVDSASKNDDPELYKLNLLMRTIRGKPIDAEIASALIKLKGLIQNMPSEFASVWQNYYDSYFTALTALSSDQGWFIDTITTSKIKQEINSPLAKKEFDKMMKPANDET